MPRLLALSSVPTWDRIPATPRNCKPLGARDGGWARLVTRWQRRAARPASPEPSLLLRPDSPPPPPLLCLFFGHGPPLRGVH